MGGEELVLSFIGLDLLSNVANAIGSKIEGLMRTVNSSGSELGKSFTNVGQTAIGMGAGLLGVSAALSAVVVGAAMMAGTFEAKMTLLHTQAGASTAEVQKMTKAVLDMAPAVGFGPDKLADAMYHVESLGFRGAAAIDLLTTAAKGAQIGNADLEATVNALGGALVAQIGGVNNAQQAMAVLDATVGVGNMRMQDLVSAMSTGVIPAGKNFGLTLQEIGGALATLTDNAVPADEAATRLRMTFALIGAPSAAAQKQLKTIGLDVLQLGKDMRSPAGLIGALTDLRGHLQKTFGPGALDDVNRYTEILAKQGPAAADAYATAAGKASYVITRAFGGGRSSAGIMTLLNNLDRLKQRTDTISSMTGTFGERFAERSQNLTFRVDQLRASFERMVIVLGTALIPVVERVVAFITPIVNAIGAWIEQHQKLAAAILVGTIIFTALAGIFLVVFGVIAIVIGGILALVVALPMIGAAIAPILVAIGITLGVFALLVAAIIAVVLVITHWQQIVGIARAVWSAVTAAIRSAWDSIVLWVRNGVNNVIASNVAMFTGVTGWVRRLVEAVVGAVSGFVTNVGKLWQKFANDPIYWVGYAVGWIVSTVVNLHARVEAELQQLVDNAVKSVATFVGNYIAWWMRLPGAIAKITTDIASNVSKWASDMKSQGIAMATQFVAGIGRWLAALPGTVQAILTQVIAAVGRWIGDMGSNARKGGNDFVDSVKSALRAAPGEFVQIGKNMIQGVIDGIRSMINAGQNAVGSFVHGLIAAAQNAGQGHSPFRLSANKIGVPFAQGIALGLYETAGEVQQAIANIVAQFDPGYTGDAIRKLVGGMTIGQAKTTVSAARNLPDDLAGYEVEQAYGLRDAALAQLPNYGMDLQLPGYQKTKTTPPKASEQAEVNLLQDIADKLADIFALVDSAISQSGIGTTGQNGISESALQTQLGQFGWWLMQMAESQRMKGMRPVGHPFPHGAKSTLA